MQSYWYIVVGIIGGSIAAVIMGKKRSPKFAHLLDRIDRKSVV